MKKSKFLNKNNNINKSIFIVASIATLSLAPPNAAFAEDYGKLTIDERYRYETVEQDALSKKARASTLRTRIGYLSPTFHWFRFGVEAENIAEIGGADFNNTLNGNTLRPVVADVRSTEINQAYLEFFTGTDTQILGGRYRKNIDNQRFVGSVGWRQNDQTFDGVTITTTLFPDTEIFYGYVGKVNRIFSDRSLVGDPASNIHIANAKFNKVIPKSTITSYAYLIDVRELDGLSSASYGVNLVGAIPLNEALKFSYRFEYAFQEDFGDNPASFDADYYHIAPALSSRGLKLTAGYEVLGSDNGLNAFQTPLATLHKFNGFADVFLNTPATGLRDYYIDATYKVSGLTGPLDLFNGLLLKAQYHDFQSDEGSIDYGTEIDFYAKLPLTWGLYVEAKYANYNADQFSTDAEKFILGIGYKTSIDINQLRK